ncbi:glycosyltransferase family 4 protein [Candidatus Parcubacteria bacterium]|nr:glycosyltransferase family 4 protein [Candidatus Parcubacteria bacterium]
MQPKRKLKIAIMGTNIAPTPPGPKTIYAPLWIAHDLAAGLKKRGHSVTLFASSDSKAPVKIVSAGLPCFKNNKSWQKAQERLSSYEKRIMQGEHQYTWAIKWKEVLRENYELLLASKLYQMAQQGKFDVIQFHSPLRVLHSAPLIKTPIFFTMHDPLRHPFNSGAVKTICDSIPYKNVRFISISNAQRKLSPNLPYAGTCYNGIDIDKFKFKKEKEDYFLFAGRIIPQKGLHLAVEIAKEMGLKLKIAGPVGKEQKSYWKSKIEPHLSSKIEYLGVLTPSQMVPLYQKAKGFLMPILWSESFGLVMAEAMACGTPVIGFNKGSVAEVVKHNQTGFVVETKREMKEAIKKIDKIKPEDCRAWVEDNFTIDKMVDSYENLYLKYAK